MTDLLGGKFPEALHLLHERRAFQVEELGGTALIAARPLERTLNEFALDMRDECAEVEAVFGKRHGRRQRRLLRLLNFHRQIRHVDLRPSRADCDGALDGILELPDVPGPRVRHQAPHRILVVQVIVPGAAMRQADEVFLRT